MSITSLLPSNASPLERKLSVTNGRFNPEQIVKTLWNSDTCPLSVLPFLAWANGVDEWDDAWAEDKKRSIVKESRKINSKRGTPSAIRRVLTALGQADAKIVERSGEIVCDGSVTCNGDHRCSDEWATYSITLYNAVTVSEAQMLKRLLIASGRGVVHIDEINFTAAAFRCDGTIICNGEYTCGAVDMTIN